MATIINLTPHAINITNGASFAPSGAVARVSVSFSSGQCPVDAATTGGACQEAQELGFCRQECLSRETITNSADCNEIPIFNQEFGQIQGLPDPQPDTFYLVSAIVLDAAKASGRTDCLAPATGHHETVRNAQGHIVSVPGFVK